MFRIFIFTIIVIVVFIIAYRLVVHMLNSRNQKLQFKQDHPDATWRSIYKPIGIVAASGFALIAHYNINDSQYLIALAAAVFAGISVWVYRKC
ncbi:MAG: hypothetical protein HRU29_05405 [Rhizobiales bacterium]|nr:hypothetical protein [Hyphomicrobiales bacterium]NRB13820.1 hypothetical protein [Hyphomicrobiales bacterium]